MAMRLAVLLPTVLLAGCGGMPFGLGMPADSQALLEGVDFTVQPGSAVAGQPVALSLHNGTAEPVAYNLCHGALEKLGADIWVPALSAANGCAPVSYTLEPGQQASAEAVLPAGLEAGEYRFVTRVNAPSGRWPLTQIRSDPIVVAAAGGD